MKIALILSLSLALPAGAQTIYKPKPIQAFAVNGSSILPLGADPNGYWYTAAGGGGAAVTPVTFKPSPVQLFALGPSGIIPVAAAADGSIKINGSGGGGGTGTVNSASAYSPAYYPATGTAVSGTTPFSGLAYFSTAAAPAAATSTQIQNAIGSGIYQASGTAVTSVQGLGPGAITTLASSYLTDGASLAKTVNGVAASGNAITLTPANIFSASQTANTFFAAPSGTAGAPTFRSLVSLDLAGAASTGLSDTSNIAYLANANTFTAVQTLNRAAVANSISYQVITGGSATTGWSWGMAGNTNLKFTDNSNGTAAIQCVITTDSCTFPNQVTAKSIIGGGTLPTATAGTGAGTSPGTITVTGTSLSGTISFTTGTSPAATAPVVTLAWSAVVTAAQSCSIIPQNIVTAAALTTLYSSTPTTTGVVFNANTALTASTAYKWGYQCF